MKILYCIPALFNSGGMERVLSIKANYLADVLGHEVHIATTDQQGNPFYYPLSSAIVHDDLDINYSHEKDILSKLTVWKFKDRIYKRRLTSLIRKYDIDICISMGWKELNFLQSLSDRCKVICEWHFAQNSSLVYAQNRYKLPFISKMIGGNRMRNLLKNTRNLDAMIVLTKEDQKVWSKTHSNIVQIYNPSTYPVDELSTLDARRMISVGRLDPQKGYGYLLKAWKIVHGSHPEWKMDIYGEGALKDQLLNEINESGLNGVVSLKGVSTSLHNEYMASSCYVMSSQYEGFPMVLLEAASFGLPLISFDCKSGPNEIIQDGVNGILVPQNDIEKLAHAIISLIEDTEKRKEMGRHSAAQVKQFSLPDIMQKWDELFNSLINQCH